MRLNDVSYFRLHHINYASDYGDVPWWKRRTWFHHRWILYAGRREFSVEFVTGPCLRVWFDRGDQSEQRGVLGLGLGVMTLYFGFPLADRWLDHRTFKATWDDNKLCTLVQEREYGFYVSDWTFRWSWHARGGEWSSTDPWWMSGSINFPDLLFGRQRRVVTQLWSTHNIWFSLGGKEFMIDDINWERVEYFRAHIPFSVYRKTKQYVEIKIGRPPAYNGKGENSWDCGDDGTYGLSREWHGSEVSHKTSNKITEEATKLYVDSVVASAHRYGHTKGEDGFTTDEYQYIGRKDLKHAGQSAKQS